MKKLFYSIYAFAAIAVLGFSISIATRTAEGSLRQESLQKTVAQNALEADAQGQIQDESLGLEAEATEEAAAPLTNDKKSVKKKTSKLKVKDLLTKEQRSQLTLKERIAAKVLVMKANKVLKKANREDRPAKGKSQLVALLLCIFVGALGIHRFYLGYTGAGIIQLLTAGLCGIWTLIDLIRIITGDLEPKDGPYEETF
ncbi:MAG: TM2 domain-containing protein [Bacteroidota bacterium]